MTEFVDCDKCGSPCYDGRMYCKECLFIIAEHKQIETSYGTIVDEELVTVLECLWDIGLETSNSCQNNHGNIWIEFETETFMNMMDTIRLIENIPLYQFLLKSFVLKTNMGELDDDDDFDDSVAVRFPRKHLAWFEDEIIKLRHILWSVSEDEEDDYEYYEDDEDYEDNEDE